MYQPSQFVEDRPEVLRSLVQAHPLGTLVTLGPDGLRADHIPFLIEDHGGHIWAENRSEGGARFVIELPLITAG